MEIKTRRDAGRSEEPVRTPPPERSRYLRRKTVQKVRRTPWTRRVLLRGLQVSIGVVAVASIVGGGVAVSYFLLTSAHFETRAVSISGCSRTGPEQLEAIVRREFPGSTLRIDLNAVCDRLEREPWIRQADARRILPSELAIRVAEREPAVILELRGDLWLADAEGVLLDRYDPRHGKLDMPVFTGFRGDNPEGYKAREKENVTRVEKGLEVLSELESGSPAFTRSISELNLSELTNVKLLLVDDTAEILLGDRDFLKRFQTLMSNLKQYEELKSQYDEIASVDLRFEGQIVYRPRANPAAQGVAGAEARP